MRKSPIQIASKYIVGENKYRMQSMFLYGIVDQFVKGNLTRKEIALELTSWGMPSLRICSLLTELDECDTVTTEKI